MYDVKLQKYLFFLWEESEYYLVSCEKDVDIVLSFLWEDSGYFCFL